MPDSEVNDLTAILGERRNAQHVIGDFFSRENILWQVDHKQRIRNVRAIRRGEWSQVFPNGSTLREKPKTPNYVQLALDHRVSIATRSPFTYRCDPRKETKGATEFAKLREKIAANYTKVNNYSGLLRYWYQDLDIAGVSYALILPDSDGRDIRPDGFPCIRRLNPLNAWPDAPLEPGRPLQNLIFAYDLPLRVARSLYPAHEDAFIEAMGQVSGSANQREAVSDTCTILEWYDSAELMILAAVKSATRRHGVELFRAQNRLMRPPIVAASRASDDGIPSGIFDQALAPLEAENRIMNLLIDGSADQVSSPIVEYDIENWEQYGSGAVMHGRSPQAFIRRQLPDGSNPQIYNILAQLRGTARESAVYPASASGSFDVQYASGAGVNASQGSYSASIAYHQDLSAEACERVLNLCFQTDEKYHPSQKFIAGDLDGTGFAESYTPDKDIAGDYSCRVEYPLAGMDPLSTEIRLTQQAGNRWISKRTAREHLPTVKDVVREEEEIIREDLFDATMLFVKQQASIGNVAPAVAMFNELARPGGDPLNLLPSMPAIITGQSSSQSAGGQQSDAFTGAAGIARGGVPAPTTTVPGVASPTIAQGQSQTLVSSRGGVPLPPLESLMVRR